ARGAPQSNPNRRCSPCNRKCELEMENFPLSDPTATNQLTVTIDDSRLARSDGPLRFDELDVPIVVATTKFRPRALMLEADLDHELVVLVDLDEPIRPQQSK